MNNRLYKLMNWPEIEAVVYAEADKPGNILGPHAAGNSTLFQVYIPDAVNVTLCVAGTDKEVKMEQADEAGFFAALRSGKVPEEYSYTAEFSDGRSASFEDPYRFSPEIPVKALKAFAEGKLNNAYEVFGAHACELKGKEGVTFAIWAPNARRVSVSGDFNGWDGRIHQMNRIDEYGVFVLFIPGVKTGDRYFYEIDTKGGSVKTVIDPFSTAVAKDDKGWYRSVVCKDIAVPASRKHAKKKNTGNEPVSIFECSLADYAALSDRKDYRSLAELIADKAKALGFTHVELKPLEEYESEESAGYETTGYFAPTSRYGSPSDFAAMTEVFHSRGLKVIMDWTLAHPSSANYALRRLDGTACFEHEDPRQGIQPQWGTLLFNYGRGEVVSFLKSSAMYWLSQFGLDGLRVDSLAQVICLDYGRNSGDWIPNIYGGHENLEAIEFLKQLNTEIKKEYPDALMITEDSSAYPNVTEPVEEGGLGFDYKWNIGWREDYMRYIALDPLFRGASHNDLTLSMVYCYSDRFILPLDISGINDVKLSLAYMMTHPGAKLISMPASGGEAGEYDALIKTLNAFYKDSGALFELDDSENGFEWINCMDSQRCVLTYIRKGTDSGKYLYAAANFSGIEQSFKMGISMPGKYTKLFATEGIKGFTAPASEKSVYTIDDDVDGRPYYIPVTLPALSLAVYGYAPFDENDREYMLKLREEARSKADAARAEAEKEEKKAAAARKKADAEAEKAKEAAKAAEEARVKAEKALAKAGEEMEKAAQAMEKAREAAAKAELAAHRLDFTESSMKK